MGMKDNPGCGFVIAAAELIAALPHRHQAKAQDLLENCDVEPLQELLSQHLPPILPRPAEVFVFGDEDTSDDLEQGTVYVLFEEEDLYTRVEKPEMQAFHKAIGQKPQFCQWTVWG